MDKISQSTVNIKNMLTTERAWVGKSNSVVASNLTNVQNSNITPNKNRINQQIIEPIPIGTDFYLFKSPTGKPHGLYIIGHGCQSIYPKTTNIPTGTTVRFYCKDGKLLSYPGFTATVSGRWSPHETISGGPIRNYNLYKYEPYTHQRISKGVIDCNIDVLSVRNRALRSQLLNPVDVNRAFEALEKYGFKYKFIDLIHCRGKHW